MKSIKILLINIILIGFFNSCSEEESDTIPDLVESEVVLIEHTFNKNAGPNKNPLKGWNSSWWKDLEYASVGFQYIPWSNFEPINNTYDFEAVEEIISRPGTIGRHVVLRLYCDWFGLNAESDGPRWLYEEEGVARLQNNNGKYITDFNNENYIKEAIEAIEALANHYDNDPRVYAFQIGVLGYWGEWHTFGFDDFSISNDSFNQILNSYKNSLNRVKIMGRYPWRDPLESTGGIGFHNDFFGPDPHSDEFDDVISSDTKWLDGPIGGEMPPEWGSEEFTEMFATPRGINMIETGHYATMSPDDAPCDVDLNGANCEGFMNMHRRMGYNFQIDKAIFPELLTTTDNFSVQLIGENIGVAPMYYDWEVQFALINENEEPISIFKTDDDLTMIKDNDSFDFSISSAIDDIEEGTYRLGVRIIQPDADQAKSSSWKLDARNTYILFANELSVISGSWDTEYALIGGWSILGDVVIE